MLEREDENPVLPAHRWKAQSADTGIQSGDVPPGINSAARCRTCCTCLEALLPETVQTVV